jgi:hypothetical protein
MFSQNYKIYLNRKAALASPLTPAALRSFGKGHEEITTN